MPSSWLIIGAGAKDVVITVLEVDGRGDTISVTIVVVLDSVAVVVELIDVLVRDVDRVDVVVVINADEDEEMLDVAAQ